MNEHRDPKHTYTIQYDSACDGLLIEEKDENGEFVNVMFIPIEILKPIMAML